jgi:hypothetical protein
VVPGALTAEAVHGAFTVPTSVEMEHSAAEAEAAVMPDSVQSQSQETVVQVL